MKKSTMIDLIGRDLENLGFCSYPDGKYLAKQLLPKLEDYGMEPPKTGWLSLDQMNKLYPDEDWKESCYDRKDINIWEPEEE